MSALDKKDPLQFNDGLGDMLGERKPPQSLKKFVGIAAGLLVMIVLSFLASVYLIKQLSHRGLATPPLTTKDLQKEIAKIDASVAIPTPPPKRIAPVKKAVIVPKKRSTGHYCVVVGCFLKEANAKTLHAKLLEEGYSTTITHHTIQEKPFYRVQVGQSLTATQAKELQQKLLAEKLPTFITTQ